MQREQQAARHAAEWTGHAEALAKPTAAVKHVPGERDRVEIGRSDKAQAGQRCEQCRADKTGHAARSIDQLDRPRACIAAQLVHVLQVTRSNRPGRSCTFENVGAGSLVVNRLLLIVPEREE